MIEYVHINSISVKGNKIFLECEDEIAKLKISEDSFSIYYDVENNLIDLEELIRVNKVIFFEERLYKLYGINGAKEQLVLASKSYLGNSVYLAKRFEVNIDNDIYFVKIYINEDSIVQLVIKKEKSESISFETVNVSNEGMVLDISSGTEIIKQAKTILVGNSNDEIFEFPCDYKINGILRFNIDFKTLLSCKDRKLTTLVVINNKVYFLRVPKEFNFKNIKLEEGMLLKWVRPTIDEAGKLFINVDSNITISPKLESVLYNNSLVIKGKVSSSIDLNSSKLIKVSINFISEDGKSYISYPVSIEESSFILSLNNQDIANLKESYQGLWNITFEVSTNDEIISTSNLFVMDKKTVSNVQRVLYTNEIAVNKEDIISEFVVGKGSSSVNLNIRSNITVIKVMFVKVKGSNLIIRFRTKENIEDLLAINLINADIIVNNEELKQHNIKAIGKKTFEVTYLTNNTKAIIDGMGRKGLNVLVKCNDKVSGSKISEIDKDTIYNSFLERVQHSKKYKKLCGIMYRKLFLKVPVKKKRIVFESFLGRNISGNPKYLYNQLVKDGLDEKYELIWILNNLDEPVEGKCKKVKRKTLKYYYYMATSKYWIFNCRQADEIKKRREVTYLQTWHGTPLKKLGMDMDSVNMAGQTNINDYKEKFKKNTRTWDYLLAQNHYSRDIFKRAFAFNKTILEGYPANDILYTDNNKESIEKVKDRLGVPKGKKVVLYAPTWRDDNFYKKGHYRMDIQLDLDKMKAELGDEYVVLLRMHYLITNNIHIDKYKGFVLNYSEGYDIQELYLISDVLITDYSSVMFDYSNLKRPIIFFTYDIEQYRDSLRGFYFDFEGEAPGPLVVDTEGVINSLKALDQINEKYREKQLNFYNKFCHIDDGNASKNILKEILSK